VVGLFTYLSVIRRAPIVFVLTGGSMVWESIVKPNLAGREHLIAVGVAIVLAMLHGRCRRLWHFLGVLLFAVWSRSGLEGLFPSSGEGRTRGPRPQPR
jgi:hypothetical protein